MDEKLLPCPFCGSAEAVSASHPLVDGWAVSCADCGASSFAVTTDDDEFDERVAVSAWNRRTPGPATLAMLEWAKGMVAAHDAHPDHGWQFDPGFRETLERNRAFIAEHEPARPGQSLDP